MEGYMIGDRMVYHNMNKLINKRMRLEMKIGRRVILPEDKQLFN